MGMAPPVGERVGAGDDRLYLGDGDRGCRVEPPERRFGRHGAADVVVQVEVGHPAGREPYPQARPIGIPAGRIEAARQADRPGGRAASGEKSGQSRQQAERERASSDNRHA